MRKVRRVTTSLVGVLSCLVSFAGARPPESSVAQLNFGGGSSALCPTEEQLSLSRPDTGAPTDVSVGLFLNDVVAIDDVTQSLTADLFLILRWTDARLADPERGSSQAVCTLPREAMWTPVVQARGLRRSESLYQDISAIDAAGTVTFARRVIAEISVPLDLRNFPFDRHTLAVEIETVFSSVDEVRLVALEELSGILESGEQP